MAKDEPEALSVEALCDDELVSFSRVFLTTWVMNGFGGLSKKDTELLIFACLENRRQAELNIRRGSAYMAA